MTSTCRIFPPTSAPHLKHALTYASQGWPVIPLHPIVNERCACSKANCRAAGKHPRVRHWPRAATTDATWVSREWGKCPDAGIGVVTGTASSLLVVDVDAATGGPQSLASLESQYGSLPETLTQTTGGGGKHHLFRMPGSPVRNSVGKLGPGLDVRADGGYIVVPPSTHASGRLYSWDDEPRNESVVTAPSWLVDLVQEPEPRKRLTVEIVREGERNSFLASEAGRLRRDGTSKSELLRALSELNIRCCTPELPLGEVREIAESVSRYRRGPAPGDPRHRYRDWLKTPEGPEDPATCHLLRTLTDYMDNKGGDCYPNIEDLAAVTKLSESTVRRRLKMAANAGWITRYQVPVSGGRFSYGYLLPDRWLRSPDGQRH